MIKHKVQNQAGINFTPPSQNCHVVWHCTAESKRESLKLKADFSVIALYWLESLRPSLERKTRPDALIGPNDSTATGWKIWWAWMFEYFAVLRVAASSAADPASRAAAATYESANGQMTVTSQVGGFPASQNACVMCCNHWMSDKAVFVILLMAVLKWLSKVWSVGLWRAAQLNETLKRITASHEPIEASLLVDLVSSSHLLA